jgi:hypothetical protein
MKNQSNPIPKAVTTLPPGYQSLYSLDLKKDIRVAMFLNIAVLIMFLVWGYIFIRIGTILRPSVWIEGLNLLDEVDLISLLMIFVVMVLLHEGIHGLFFWVFTKERPHFGFKLLYAYAAAPDWYIPRTKYLWIGLSPLVLISILGVAIIPWFPVHWLPGLILFLTINAAGSMGDVYIILVTLSHPKDILIQDLGDSFTIYGKLS